MFKCLVLDAVKPQTVSPPAAASAAKMGAKRARPSRACFHSIHERSIGPHLDASPTMQLCLVCTLRHLHSQKPLSSQDSSIIPPRPGTCQDIRAGVVLQSCDKFSNPSGPPAKPARGRDPPSPADASSSRLPRASGRIYSPPGAAAPPVHSPDGGGRRWSRCCSR